MIDVQRFEAEISPAGEPREAMQQDHGVETAGERDRDARTRIEMRVETCLDACYEPVGVVTRRRLP